MYTMGKHSWVKHLDFIVIDLVSLATSFFLSYFLRFGNLNMVESDRWMGLLGVLLLLNFVITLLTNPYSGIARRAYYEDLLKMLMLATYSFICACVFFYLFKLGEDYSRLTLAGTYVLYLIVSFTAKCIRKRFLVTKKGRDNPDIRSMHLVTHLASVDKTIEYITAGDFEQFRIVSLSFIDDDAKSDNHNDIPIIPLGNIVGYVEGNNIDDVFVDAYPSALPSNVYAKLTANGTVVCFNIERAVGTQTDVQSVERAGVYKTLNVAEYTGDSRKALYFVVKRLFDIMLGILGCILLLPIMGITKLSYLASGDSAPIIYRQERIGLRGKPFKLYKLRSMVPNADEILQELLKDPKMREEWERDQKFSEDPRITGMGRFLRKTSLDELPQFGNVLKGEMSIVGPRPLVPGELELHGGRSLYNKVKPGITGWWGCNGRSNISYRERLELEYHYVKNCSLYLDALCILRTFAAVIKRDGAR